jgi:hypothetical protein
VNLNGKLIALGSCTKQDQLPVNALDNRGHFNLCVGSEHKDFFPPLFYWENKEHVIDKLDERSGVFATAESYDPGAFISQISRPEFFQDVLDEVKIDCGYVRLRRLWCHALPLIDGWRVSGD